MQEYSIARYLISAAKCVWTVLKMRREHDEPRCETVATSHVTHHSCACTALDTFPRRCMPKRLKQEKLFHCVSTLSSPTYSFVDMFRNQDEERLLTNAMQRNATHTHLTYSTPIRSRLPTSMPLGADRSRVRLRRIGTVTVANCKAIPSRLLDSN